MKAVLEYYDARISSPERLTLELVGDAELRPLRRLPPHHAPAPRHPHGRGARPLPRLSPRVKAVLEYYDARISSPERLTLELVGDAE
ncbi:hypothetical protein CNY89_23675, partial [Amaricoccus sp. HAR-UPW-R2A-40]